MSIIDQKNNHGFTLLVWIINPQAAERIVSCAKKFADENGLELKVVSVQREAEDDWDKTIADLQKLEDAARRSDAELTVVYSDDRLKAAEEIALVERPFAMFCGMPEKSAANSFVNAITAALPDSPLYCVDEKCEVRLHE